MEIRALLVSFLGYEDRVRLARAYPEVFGPWTPPPPVEVARNGPALRIRGGEEWRRTIALVEAVPLAAAWTPRRGLLQVVVTVRFSGVGSPAYQVTCRSRFIANFCSRES